MANQGGCARFLAARGDKVLWLQVRKKRLTADEACEALAMLRAQIALTPTAGIALDEVALDIGSEVNHSTYDVLYLGKRPV